MKAYLITIIGGSLVAAIIGILSPEGDKGGIAKHIKLLTSLFLVCLLIAPLKGVLEKVQGWTNGSLPFFGSDDDTDESYEAILDGTIDQHSKKYFTQMLTEALQTQFSLKTGTIRCIVQWDGHGDDLHPDLVTVILSGNAVWQDPHAIESFVTALLECDCAVAIE